MPASDVRLIALVKVSELASGNVDMVELIQLEILIYIISACERCTTEDVDKSERVSASTWLGSAGSAQILIYIKGAIWTTNTKN